MRKLCSGPFAPQKTLPRPAVISVGVDANLSLPCRCSAVDTKHASLQCVRIEHNRDSSTTYYFSEGRSEPVRQQLEAQLATTISGVPAGKSSAAGDLSTQTAVNTACAGSPSFTSNRKEHEKGGGTQVISDADARESLEGKAALDTRRDARADLERSWAEQMAQEPPGPTGRGVYPPRLPGQTASSYGHSILSRMREDDEEVSELLHKFSELCRAGQLEAALTALSRVAEAERQDVLVRLQHKPFLKEAARQSSAQAVKQALRFVQLLPAPCASLQTYNMLVTVCTQAKDKDAAMQAADMLRSAGKKPDTALYTNIISACAAAGDADAAFRVHAEMVRDGVPTDRQVATSLINACSREIMNTCGSQRRRQLVLLERADGVLQECAIKHRGKLDQALWNAFITAAGRAAQLQRAVQALGAMQAKGFKPDAATYAAMMDACVRNNDKKLALDTYNRAMREGLASSPHLHTGAIAACRIDKDTSTALRIFSDMKRHGVQADEKLYGVLISVIGAASLSTALDLHEDLQNSGVAPLQGLLSNLIGACLSSQDLKTAKALFQRAHGSDTQISEHTTNAVLNAFAKTGSLAEVAELLQCAMGAGFKADKFTFTAVLNACQHANEGELAFSVWRLMMQQGLALDEASAFVLIRTCYNQLQLSRAKAGQEEGRQVQEVDQKERLQLLQTLGGNAGAALLAAKEEKQPWGGRAISVYQKLLAAGAKPRLHVLERLLACLRLRPLPQTAHLRATYGAPMKVRLYLLPDGRKASAPQHSVEGFYEKRAFSILEEAKGMGAVPCYKAGKDGGVDLRGMPPVVAELFVLDILAGMCDSKGGRKRNNFPLVLKTPPYTPWQRENGAGPASRTSKAQARPPKREKSVVGQAVAALLDRLNIRTVGNPATGDIILTPNALSRWKQLAERAASSVELASLSSIQKAGHIRNSIHDQQMHIRLGMQPGNEAPFRHERRRFRQHSPFESSS